jgi:hypothetical protein
VILEKIGAVAYKLALPPGSSVHSDFHVSQLKASAGSQVVAPELPAPSSFQVPEKILQHRLSSGDKSILQGLVQWSGMPAALATWENLETLKQCFPNVSPWGQVDTQEGGNVSSSFTPPSLGPSAEEPGLPRRVKKPSVRVCGPEWVR